MTRLTLCRGHEGVVKIPNFKIEIVNWTLRRESDRKNKTTKIKWIIIFGKYIPLCYFCFLYLFFYAHLPQGSVYCFNFEIWYWRFYWSTDLLKIRWPSYSHWFLTVYFRYLELLRRKRKLPSFYDGNWNRKTLTSSKVKNTISGRLLVWKELEEELTPENRF